MKTMRLLGTLGLICSVAGCATQTSPLQETHQTPMEQPLPTASYWDFLANDVVKATRCTLQKYDYLQGRPLFVTEPTPESPFGEAYRNLLITRFVQKGFSVSDDSQGAVLVNIDAQVLRDSELMTTTSLMDDSGQYLLRHTDIYFIDPKQLALYEGNGGRMPSKYLEVVDK